MKCTGFHANPGRPVIRRNHITREEGIALVKRYDGEVPKRDLAFFLEYTGICKEYFWYVIDRYIELSNICQKVNGEWIMPHLPKQTFLQIGIKMIFQERVQIKVI